MKHLAFQRALCMNHVLWVRQYPDDSAVQALRHSQNDKGLLTTPTTKMELTTTEKVEESSILL